MGAVVGLAVCVLAAVLLLRRRRRLQTPTESGSTQVSTQNDLMPEKGEHHPSEDAKTTQTELGGNARVELPSPPAELEGRNM